ncbi:MAG: sugar phosphate isomerase/epimerase [Anaerolineae bacterium]|nr:sugar phosphate isomerase/epimerase [Anaerolineae bacterium]
MALPIALQLYTVRDLLQQDFDGVIQRIAEVGYLGVEAAGVYGRSAVDAARLFRSLGLTVTSAHMPLPVGEKRQQVIDTMGELGTTNLICAWMPEDRFTSVDTIKQVCEELNAGARAAHEAGLSFAYHNHWWEPARLDSRIIMDIMQEYLDPSVKFEIDVYWVKVAGLDPAALITDLGARVPLVHLKDGSGDRSQAMTAVGQGIIDSKSVAAAAENVGANWLIVEMDRVDGDVLAAVTESYRYVIGQGLAKGRR